ncbi:MAG: PAS domain S-box protein, partial [Acidobacteriota bacterium]|nr:PAS domain S-box protein [Acidobacteriota bacterium]
MTKPRILIVEDEPIVARDVRQQLEELDYEPAGTTGRGDEAVVMVERLRPDLVLMDIHLEGDMDGIAAAGIIRERWDIPVVFLTAFAGEETLDRAKQSDPFGYIIKPFDERELRTVIEMALYKHHTSSQLRQLREEQAAILSTALDGFWLVGREGRILDANEAICRMLGYAREEMVGSAVSDYEADETPAEIAAQMERIRQLGSAIFERRSRCKDGRLIDVELRVSVLPGASGHLSAFIHDITERKRMVAALRSSEELATKTFRAIPEGVLITRAADGQILDVNEGFCRLSGWSREQAIGRKVPELNLWDSAAERDAYFETLRQHGRVENLEAVFHTKTGERRVIALSAEMMEQDHETMVLAVAHDITGIRHDEAALLASERLNRAITQSAHDAIITTGSPGKIVSWNQGAETIFGYTEAEALGQPVSMLIPESYLDRHIAGMHSIASGGESHILGKTVELMGLRKDGSEFPLELSLAHWETSEGWFATSIIRDITHRKRTEDARRHAEELVRRSETKFRTLYDASPDGVMLLDEGGFFDCNAAALKAFGCDSIEAFCSKHPADLSPEFQPCGADSRTLANQRIAAALETGHQHFEWLHQRADTGATFPAEVLLNAMELDGRRVLQAVVRDITERKRAEEALRVNEDRYRDLVENAQELITTYDLDGKILSTNETTVRNTGYSREALLQMNLVDLVAPETRHLVPAYYKTLETHGKAHGILRIQTASGETRYWEYDSTVRTEGLDKPIVRGMSLDITERRAAERALRASEAQLQVILESTDDGILAVDLKGRILKTNHRFAELWNIPESIIARGERQLLLDHVLDQLADPEAFLARAQSLNASEEMGLDLLHFKDGRCLERLSTPLRDRGSVIGRVSAFRDITERMRSEAALRENEDRYHDLIENSHEVVSTYELDGNLLSVNETAVRLTGYSRETLLKMNLADLVAPDTRHLLPEYFNTIKAEGKAHGFMQIQTASGETRIWEYDASVRTEGVATPIVRGMALDITERKQIEQALRENEDRYRDLVDNSLELISTYDLEGNFLSVNETTVRLSGYPREALLKMNLADLLDPSTRHLFPEYLETMRTSAKAQGIIRIRTATGDLRFWEYSATVRTEGISEPIVRGMALDITERLRSEKALRASEAQLQVILESTDDGILAVDQQGRILKTNRRFKEIWQIPESLIASGDDHALLDFVLSQLSDPDAFLKKVQTLYASDATDLDLIHFKDGRCFERFSSPMLDGSTIRGRVWSFRDITERKRSEEALRESEGRFRRIVDNIHDALYIDDADGKVLFANDQFLSIFGVERS